MVTQWKKNVLSLGGLMLVLLACQPGTSAAPAGNSIAALTLTSLIQTLTAPAATVDPQLASATLPAETAFVEPASPTLPAEGFPTATEFPPATLEPTIPPPTLPPPTVVTVAGPNNPAPAPSVPMASITTGTSCRSGPGEVYANVGDVPAGGRFVLTGKNTPRNYWILRLQNGRDCWLPAGYAVVEGNVASLPEYAIPAEPVPQVGSITGRVEFMSGPARFQGQFLPSIEVIVTTNTTEFSQMTNENDGTYTFQNVPVGPVIVSFKNTSALSTHNSFTVTLQSGQIWQAPLATVSVTIPSERHPTPCGVTPFCGNTIPTLLPPVRE